MLIVFNLVGCHVSWAVNDNVFGELVSQCRLGSRAGNSFVAEFKNARREVHGTSQTARERQDALVIRRIAATTVKGVILLTTHALGGNEIGPRALQAAGHGTLVVDDHHVVTCCCLNHLAEVLHAPLRVLQLTIIEMGIHITRLDRVDAQ